MDSQNIGKVILLLRKHNKWTQLQLAQKLYVSDKAVSKWELGLSIPDLQQIEAITKLFNISYDMLLNGDVDKVNLFLLQEEGKLNQKVRTKERFNPLEWYKLDNAAKVYPTTATAGWNQVFRVAAVFKEQIDKDTLEIALRDMVDRFPSFMVTLKKGAFWYYFDRIEKMPEISIGAKYPCRPIPLDGKKYLFRVLIENNRLACEYFHSLTDGTGGAIFLVSLITRYYEIKYGPIKEYRMALNYLDKAKEEECQDSFKQYATNTGTIKRKIKHAYKIHDKKIKNPVVTHVVLDAEQLKNLTKKYNCTMTVFLSAVFTQAFLKRRAFDKDKRPYIIQIPVNLRNKFPSDTLRNFAYFTGVEVYEKELTLEEIIKTTKEQIEKGTTIDVLQKSINTNVRDESNPLVRIAPLIIKKVALKIASAVIGDEGFTTVFSNLGKLDAPEELKSIIDRFELVTKDDRKGGVSMCGISFNNKSVISFIRSVEGGSIERDFARELSRLGLSVYVEGNGGDYESM